ncbi:MAG: hypothetical protein ACOX06_01255 [Candidatus Dojkabacteria bacterium]|jgi:hypothetical protein
MVSDNDLETEGTKQERQDNTETTQWASTHPDRQDIGISYPSQNESAGPTILQPTNNESLDDTEMTNTNPTSFYNEHGQILDPKHAEDIAYVAKEEGIDKAIQREQALKTEFEKELTPVQQYNRTIIEEGLLKKYPNAFRRVTLTNGETGALLEAHYNEQYETFYGDMLFTDNGFLAVSGDDRGNGGKRPMKTLPLQQLEQMFENAEKGEWDGFKPNPSVRRGYLQTGSGRFYCRFQDKIFANLDKTTIQRWGKSLALLEKKAQRREEATNPKKQAQEIIDLF